MNIDLGNASEYERGEVFADIFAMSVMYNTELEKYNPFPFHVELQDCFEKYFKNKCNEYLQK